MRRHIGKNLNSEMVNFWHVCWPQWEMYCRELDYSTSWVSRICGNTFYCITGERTGEENKAILHKSTIGTESKEDIQTWSEARIFEDKEKNIRILATNLQGNSYYFTEWILLNDFGEVLWEEEKAADLRVRAQGWCFDLPSGDIHNSYMLLDFYTGNILLKGHYDYTYYINNTGEIIIAADKIGDDYKRCVPQLYHYKNGEALRFNDEEIIRYGIKPSKKSYYKLQIPQFKEMKIELREIFELPTRN